jgi:hypothetical protein
MRGIEDARRIAGIARRARRSLSLSRRQVFVTTAPSAQTAVEAVPDAWASRLPGPLRDVRAGEAELFEDSRIHWAFERLGGIAGPTVLDLGPLEGGYSYMAQQVGAAKVIGIEANSYAFLKCLVTKELLGLDRCSFLCGEVTAYLRTHDEPVDWTTRGWRGASALHGRYRSKARCITWRDTAMALTTASAASGEARRHSATG